jgi:DNA-binding beta-propeller fold protein YncE
MRRFAWMPATAAAACALAMLPGAAAVASTVRAVPFPCPDLAGPGYCGDGGPALRAGLSLPVDVAALPDGGYVIADAGNDAVRAVTPDGRITTLAGGERAGRRGVAHLRLPSGVAADSGGRIFVADTGDNRVLVLERSGVAHRIAGDGVAGHRGDGGPARLARLAAPTAVAPAADGTVLIADTGNDRVRRVGIDGTIMTVARVRRPMDVAVLVDQSLLVASANGELYRITADGATVLVPVDLGDDPAIASLPDGGAVAANPTRGRVIRLHAGSFAPETLTSSSCPTRFTPRPTTAALRRPAGLTSTPSGEILVTDTATSRIVRLTDGAAQVIAGAGLPTPVRPCKTLGAMPDPPNILARLRANPVGTDAGYGPPFSCADRYYWTFQLRFRFIVPRVPRVRRTFAMYYSSSRRVRIHLTLRRAGLTRRIPRHSFRTQHPQFRIVVRHGLRRAGRYRTRLVATAGLQTQCVNRTIRIRKRR